MKLIAKTKDGDIYEVRLQRMFPNCDRYTKCCTDDMEFWEKYQKRVKELKPKKQELRWKSAELRIKPTPKGF